MTTYSLHQHHSPTFGSVVERLHAWLSDRTAAWNLQHDRLVALGEATTQPRPWSGFLHTGSRFGLTPDADRRRVEAELMFRTQQG